LPTSPKPKRTRRARPRVPLASALEMGRRAQAALARAGAGEISLVGAARRGHELLERVEMIARLVDAETLARALGALEGCRARVDARDVVRVSFDHAGDAVVRIVPEDRWIEWLVRATGSARHVRWLSRRASDRGGALSAIFAGARSEVDVYARLRLPWAAPELRDGPTPRMPALVDSVRGIFHVHTTWSDGTASIAEMARAAADAGFAYVGVTEHSRAATYAGGLDAAKLREQSHAVSEARRLVSGVHILHGVEVDVMKDGSLDLDDATLGALDFVIASVHVDLDLSPRAMTARIVRAVSHPLVTILGHPTGRLLLGRAGYAFDIDAVADAAAANDTFLEINANPQRLDLGEDLVRRAAARGARFAIDPDAHAPRGVRDTALGITVARRAGLTAGQVLNAMGPAEVAAFLSARRRKGIAALAALAAEASPDPS
jgi:DNA polymerase (family 10)